MLPDDFTQGDRPHVAKIVRLYDVLLGRDPDPEGLALFARALRDGADLATIVGVFLDGDEFRDRRGNGEPVSADDVRALYSAAGGAATQTSAPAAPAPWLATMIERDEASGRVTVLPVLWPRGPSFADPVAYAWWDEECGRLAEPAWVAGEPTRLSKLSLVVAVEDADAATLPDAVRSVQTQTHRAFELLLAARGPMGPALAEVVRALQLGDDRIRLVTSPRWRGSAAAWNKALRTCVGDFVGAVGAADRLAPTALSEFAATAARWPDTQVMYCDEDALALDGTRSAPRFKAAFDIDRMLTGDYVGRLALFRTGLLRRLGGRRSAAKGAAEYDLALRATIAVSATAVRHVPHVLYHRRPASGADADAPARLAAATRALRRSEPGGVVSIAPPSLTGLAHAVPRVRWRRGSRTPLASLVVPTRDRRDLLEACLDGLLNRTSYPSVEVVVIDNDSVEPDAVAFLADLARDPRVTVLSFPGPFNWAAMNNAGVGASSGEVVVLLNNDTEVLHADWLDELVGQAMRPDVGAVGAKLLFPRTGRLQHGGVVLGPDGAGRHVFRDAAADDPGYLDMLASVRTVSAVTGACLALRRSVFDEVGGIEQEALRVTCSDVDLCLRVRERGYRVVWTPFARLWHDELSTRGADDTPEKVARAAREQAWLARRWAAWVADDRHWPANLALDERVGILAMPPGTYRSQDHLRAPQGLANETMNVEALSDYETA